MYRDTQCITKGTNEIVRHDAIGFCRFQVPLIILRIVIGQTKIKPLKILNRQKLHTFHCVSVAVVVKQYPCLIFCALLENKNASQNVLY